MPRLVRHSANAPHRIDPQDQPVFICMCGLSKKEPFCDGSHKTCRDEKPDVLYVYDKDRSTVVEQRTEQS